MTSPLNRSNDFNINNLVFAKVKGHPYWPAMIINVDKQSYKNTVKYEIKFFSTNEVARVNKIDICHYYENKLRYTLESVSKKHKESYKSALEEISKAWESRKSKTSPNTDITRQTVVRGTPLSHTSKGISSKNTQDCDVFTPKSVPNIKDATVNTPLYFDLNFQLKALTEKCIELEKQLMEKNKLEIDDKINENFHTQILKQELNKYKQENMNLQAAIEILQAENKKLDEEIKYFRGVESDRHCINCYPPLAKYSSKNEWNTVSKKHSMHKNIAPIQNTIKCFNKFSSLAHDNNKNKVNAVSNERPKSNTYPNHVLKQKSKYSAYSQNKISNQSKLLIMADSHGRNLSALVQQRTSIEVSSIVKPGARFNRVTENVGDLTKNLNKNDYILLIAGTNNIETTNNKQLLSEIQKVIAVTQHTNLLLATIPMRHDTPKLDVNIACINSELERIETENVSGNIKLLPLHLLSRDYFTLHGLHFNKKGKSIISRMIVDHLSSFASDKVCSEDSKNDPKVINGKEVTVCKEDMDPLIPTAVFTSPCTEVTTDINIRQETHLVHTLHSTSVNLDSVSEGAIELNNLENTVYELPVQEEYCVSNVINNVNVLSSCPVNDTSCV